MFFKWLQTHKICNNFSGATFIIIEHFEKCAFQWKRISCKQSAWWQHLSQLKDSAFFSFFKILVVKKHNILYLGLVMPSSGWKSPIWWCIISLLPWHIRNPSMVSYKHLSPFTIVPHKKLYHALHECFHAVFSRCTSLFWCSHKSLLKMSINLTPGANVTKIPQ